MLNSVHFFAGRYFSAGVGQRPACLVSEHEQRALFCMFNAGADAADFALTPYCRGIADR
jgi:hypothetical protein